MFWNETLRRSVVPMMVRRGVRHFCQFLQNWSLLLKTTKQVVTIVGSKNSIDIHSCYFNKSHMLFSKWTLNSANLLNLFYNDLWGLSTILLVVDVALLALLYVIWWSWHCRNYLKSYDDMCRWFMWSITISIYMWLSENICSFYVN